MKNKMRGWEFRKGIEDAAHKICSAMGLKPITLRWDDIPTACISGNLIVLSDVADDAVVNKQLFMRYMGFIVHEFLHRKYTTNGLSHSSHYVRMLWNALEDARIEHTGIVAGLTGNIKELLTSLAHQMVDDGMEQVDDWSNPAQFPFVLAMYCRDHVTKKVPVHPTALPIFAEARVRLRDCDDSRDVAELAQWVFDQLEKAAEEQPPETDGNTPTEEPADNPDNPDDLPINVKPVAGEGDPADNEDGEDGEDGSGEIEGSGGKDGEDGKEGKKPAPMRKPDVREAVDPEPKLDREENVGGGVSWSPDRTMARDQQHARGIDTNPSWELKPVGGAKLRYEVRRLFEMSGIDEYQFNRRNGQLDAGNLHTIPTGNDRVFKRHHEEGGVDSAVVFIMDCSGSMFNGAMNAAAPVMATMLDTLDRAGVATSIVTFGTQVSLLKPWNMTKAKAMPFIERLRSGSDNSDSQALRYAHSLLLPRPEKRKVVFILADGGVDYEDEKRCMEQARSGERLGITTIGIGIHADLSRMYPNNIVVNSLTDLASTSFKQIKLAA